MSVLTITRNSVTVYVRKMQIKELKPSRLKNTKWKEQHKYSPNSYVLVVCNKEGEIKFSCAKEKYKIHHISKGDLLDEKVSEQPKVEESHIEESQAKDFLYEDYYSFPLVDYLEETMFK